MTLTLPTPENTYEPRGAARELWHTKDAAETLMDGPAGTGKSRALLELIHALCEKYPNSRHLIYRKTRTSMSQSVLVTYETKVLPEGHPCRDGGASREYRKSYIYPNGSEIVVGGLDNPDRLMSTEYDTISAFEATEIDENDWEKTLTRLRNGKMGYHRAFADCNPSHPAHWLNRRANSGKMKRLLSRHADNPSVTPEYLALLAGLTGARRARLFEGRWAAAEGMVYAEYDAAKHVIQAMPEGWQVWRKYRAIDFGFNDPFVCLWIADSGEALYVYRELYMSGRIVADHAREIVRLSAGESYEATVADHDREDRETLHRGGVFTEPAKKDIDIGIDAVKDRLKVGTDGKPRLFILSSCLVERDAKLDEAKRPVSIHDEWDAYIYKQDRAGAAKDEPVDRDNHGLDALRYAVMRCAGGGAEPYFSMGS